MSRPPTPDPETVSFKVLMLGLEAAGKTTVLKQISTDFSDEIIPTHGFNCQGINFKNKEFYIWDIGGSEYIRTTWHVYYDTDVKGLIFVVDASDRNQMDLAAEVLREVLGQESMKTVPLLLIANKQEQQNVMGDSHIVEKIGLEALRGRRLFVQKATATTGEGLLNSDGFSWFYNEIISDSEK